ncbi:TRAP transporter small permease [Phaeodactylibacter sp.]|jgi:TRAP-type C4-dicarboxylate transport system permease small subunit|uniref:TRAP transporter small permease n=1 Tax=Phaeodactylibacter sp. TaxID=1940289 RepID=UPI0025D2A254|nr:TRAP transporter small permease [Phaeodactylibacter sp.]MCI4650181.1 TRAP transporter small permease [Phaeodactylibacter sp.]MCI5093269.1 TRAP transporter small permease [Phaeodactylibacter sp.]
MRNNINKYVGYFLAFLMAVMTVDVLWGVFTRYIMGSQSPWTEELARFLLIWIGLLGAAYVAGQNQHLAIDILPERLEGAAKQRLQWAIRLLIAGFSATVLVAGGARLVYITYKLGQYSAALQVPLSVVYSVVPVSGLLIIYYKLAERGAPTEAQA